ncbi:MAG: TVP38/TMEM64 family protein [Oscillospiraceae bacterium]
MKNKKRAVLFAAACGLFILLLALLVADLIPLIRQLAANTKDESAMIDYIKAYGTRGVPLLAGLQALAVVVPFIPSLVVQILAGLCYGILYGGAICLVGFAAMHSLLFYGARQFGSMFGGLFGARRGRVSKSMEGWLKKIKNPALAVFLLYLVPFVPNSMLPFLFAKSGLPFRRYFLAMAGATFPAIVVYCWLGERLGRGDYKTALVIAAVVLAAGALFLLVRGLLARKEGGRGKAPQRGQQSE